MEGEAPGDDRFEIIAEAKRHLLECTNVGSVPEEMKVLDSILYRCWQMGWLDGYGKEGFRTDGARIFGLEKRVADIEKRLERMGEKLFMLDGRTAPLAVVGRAGNQMGPFDAKCAEGTVENNKSIFDVIEKVERQLQ